MKDYSQIITRVTSTPWMMEPKALKMMLEILEAHLQGTMSADQIRVRLQDVGGHEASLIGRYGPVGVLPLHGPIFPKADLMTKMSGATSLESFQKDFRAMMADDGIRTIVLDVDSPGGSAALVPEMMDEIRQARSKKPILSIANTSANSAAYGLAASASEMYATPSAQVGSVGTYLVHEDESRKLDKEGIDQTIIKAGRFKAMHLESLTPEMREQLQDFVDQMNDQFINGIALGRNTTPDVIRETYGEGMILTPTRASETGMIDGVATFDQVMTMANYKAGGMQSDSPVYVAATATQGNFTITASDRTTPLRQSYDADMEHSEPGTGFGGPPAPAPEPEEGDLAIEGGWRRDPPPIVKELEAEENAVNREWLEGQATSLGVEFSSDTTDEELSKAVATRIDEVVVPLNRATAAANKQNEFAEQFPEQAERLARLEQRDRENAAREYADGYAQFEDQRRGFSPVVRQEIENAHEAIAGRQFSHVMLTSLLDAVAGEYATVPSGELGSSRQLVRDSAAVPNDFREARQQFADLVQKAMTDDNLSQEAAYEHVSEQNPELAKAYLIGHVGR